MKMKMLDLSNKTHKQLIAMMDMVSRSDADDEVKIANMEAIKDKLYNKNYVQALKDIRDAEPDYSDIYSD